MSKGAMSCPVLGAAHHHCRQAQERAPQAKAAWGKTRTPLPGLGRMGILGENRCNRQARQRPG